MDQVSLRAVARTEAGTRPSRRLRRGGHIPGVVYGRGLEPIAVAVATRDLFSVLHTAAGLNALISLDVDGSKVLTVAREIQRHPVRGDITHLDFIQVSLTEPIQADVLIDFQGIPVGVSQDGGVVETIETTVSIRALPAEIPTSIAVDISALEVGDTLLLGDLPSIAGVEYVDDAERPLATVLHPRIVEEAEAVPEEGEEPGADADGAEDTAGRDRGEGAGGEG